METRREVFEVAPDLRLLVEYAETLPSRLYREEAALEEAPEDSKVPYEDMVMEWEVLSVSIGICDTHHGSAS